MRVLMVNKYLYPRAGAETYMLTVADELLARGHEVAFFGMEDPRNAVPGPVLTAPAVELGQQQGVTGKLINLARCMQNSLSGELKHSLDVFVQEFQPDIVHAHNVYHQLSPRVLSGLSENYPVIMTAHDYKPVCPNYSLFVDGETCTRCLKGGYYNCLVHRCNHKSFLSSTLATTSAYYHEFRKTYHKVFHHYIAPSHFMRDKLVEGGIEAEKTSVLHNFAQIYESPPPKSNGIFYFGRLSVEKGIDTLIKAYVKLEEPRPPLTIAGTGPLEQALKQLAEDAGAHNIRWLGHVSQEKVREELEKCGCSVVPSLWFENCSMAILESLAFGRAVVASSSGGNPELVREGVNGAVFTAGDVDSLKEALERVTGSQERLALLGKQARESVCSDFSVEKHVDGLLEIYSSARVKHF